MTEEGKVKELVKALLKARNVWYFLPVSGGMGVHGIPDFICCHQGRFFGIETKAPGRKPTALQLIQMEKIIKAGGKWFLVDGMESLKEVEAWLG